MWGFRRSISSSAQRIFLSWAAMFSPWELGGTGIRGRSDGQHHGDRGPVTRHGLHDGDSAPMILAHHAPRKREPEPPAAPLRGEPRRERATALRGGHAAAVVLDEDLDLAPLGAPAHGDLDRTARLVGGVDGVRDEILDHQFDQLLVEGDAWNGLVTLHDLDLRAQMRQPMAEIAHHTRDRLDQVPLPQRRNGAQLAEARRDLVEPLDVEIDLGGDRLDPPLRRVAARGSLAQVRGPSEERGERRPELVRGLLGHGGPQRALLPGHDRPESHESEDEEHEYDAELDV